VTWPFKSRYVQLLESENARKDVEIRSLMNQLLVAKGFKTIEADLNVAPPLPKPQKPKGWNRIGKFMRKKSAESRFVLDLVPQAANGKDGVRP
jgi:hypothetical protein